VKMCRGLKPEFYGSDRACQRGWERIKKGPEGEVKFVHGAGGAACESAPRSQAGTLWKRQVMPA
jgi:hypothetical protein